MDEINNPVTLCRLDDGRCLIYDGARETQEPFNEHFELIGHGVIYSVDGVIQNPQYSTPLYFFRKIS